MHSLEEGAFEVAAGLLAGMLLGCLVLLVIDPLPDAAWVVVLLGVACGYAGRWIAWRYFSTREAGGEIARYLGPVVSADLDTGEQCLLLHRICRLPDGRLAFCFNEADDCFRIEMEPAEIAQFIASQWSPDRPSTPMETVNLTSWDVFLIDASIWWRSSRLGRWLRGDK